MLPQMATTDMKHYPPGENVLLICTDTEGGMRRGGEYKPLYDVTFVVLGVGCLRKLPRKELVIKTLFPFPSFITWSCNESLKTEDQNLATLDRTAYPPLRMAMERFSCESVLMMAWGARHDRKVLEKFNSNTGWATHWVDLLEWAHQVTEKRLSEYSLQALMARYEVGRQTHTSLLDCYHCLLIVVNLHLEFQQQLRRELVGGGLEEGGMEKVLREVFGCKEFVEGIDISGGKRKSPPAKPVKLGSAAAVEEETDLSGSSSSAQYWRLEESAFISFISEEPPPNKLDFVKNEYYSEGRLESSTGIFCVRKGWRNTYPKGFKGYALLELGCKLKKGREKIAEEGLTAKMMLEFIKSADWKNASQGKKRRVLDGILREEVN